MFKLLKLLLELFYNVFSHVNILDFHSHLTTSNYPLYKYCYELTPSALLQKKQTPKQTSSVFLIICISRGAALTTSLRGVHPCPCVTSPHRHVDHKSCQDDAPKLLEPSSYAHIITTTPFLRVSPCSPSTHSIVDISLKDGVTLPDTGCEPTDKCHR